MQGDQKAQSALYKLCYPILMRIGWRYETEDGMAAEYVNIAFLKIIQNLSKYAESVPFEAWIRRIMINCVIDEFRKNKKYKDLIVRNETGVFTDNDYSVDVNEADQLLSTEDIHKLLKLLPEATAKVFNLFVFDEYTHKEISQLLGISEGTSKWHVSHARQELKKHLVNMLNLQKKMVKDERIP
ncbi:MAG: sigma-70 family RNA polymerase sigma factor [Bacteroidia bacterium]|nr:sigma-70 family RNA polymerase sigma factor [Bacteroidia bacterium]